MGYAVIGFCVVIYVVVFIVAKQRKDKLLREGKTIKRDRDFYRQKETFTLRPFEFDRLVGLLEQMKWDGMDLLNYNKDKEYFVFGLGKEWKGVLTRVDDRNGFVVYECQFMSWTTKNGSNLWVQQMNIALTNIEKALVMLDSETTVCAEYVKTKAK